MNPKGEKERALLLKQLKEIHDPDTYIETLSDLLKDTYWDTKGKAGLFSTKLPKTIEHMRGIVADSSTNSLTKIMALVTISNWACSNISKSRDKEVTDLYKTIQSTTERVKSECQKNDIKSSKGPK